MNSPEKKLTQRTPWISTTKKSCSGRLPQVNAYHDGLPQEGPHVSSCFFLFFGGAWDEIRERLRISHVLIGFQMIYLDWCGQFLARIHAFKHSWVNFMSMSPDDEAMSSGCRWLATSPDEFGRIGLVHSHKIIIPTVTQKRKISGTPTTPSFLRWLFSSPRKHVLA